MTKEEYIDMETRLGFADITVDLLEDEPEFFEKYLPDCEILSYEDSRWEFGVRTYKLRCPEFDELKIGETIPFYYFTFERSQDNSTIRLPVTRV